LSDKKVIFLMTFSPHYVEFENQPRPPFCWTNQKGEWIGIWGLDWGDLLLKTVADYYQQYQCEVWQPDYRADRTYTADLQTRLKHINFPAEKKRVFQRYRFGYEIYSEQILRDIEKNDTTDTVIMLPSGVYDRWLNNIIGSIKKAVIVYYNLLNISKLLPETAATANPLKALNRYFLTIQKSKCIKRMKILLTGHNDPQVMEGLHSINPMLKVFDIDWGLDHDFWYPAITKEQARVRLDIPQNEYLIILSQRLVPEYQVDRFIEVLSSIDIAAPFRVCITGHGKGDYEDYLKHLSNKLKMDKLVHFVGFVPDEDLRCYLIAADLFATLATKSAGSGGAVKAMAVGTPVLATTTSGDLSDYLRSNKAGMCVDPYAYDEWKDRLRALISGSEITTVPIDQIKKDYDWKNTADSLHNAFCAGD
jgi:glycosyltransferase involved in cell wall biosynthesis